MARLTFRIEHQGATNWCWAAVAVSVNSYYHPGADLPQCKLVEAVISAASDVTQPVSPQWCAKPVEERCDLAYRLGVALESLSVMNGDPLGRPLSFEEIQREIDQQRPVCARIRWSGPGNRGHFVVIFGYHTTNGQQTLDVKNPDGGSGTETYDKLKSNYQDEGTWSHTYLTEKGS